MSQAVYKNKHNKAKKMNGGGGGKSHFWGLGTGIIAAVAFLVDRR